LGNIFLACKCNLFEYNPKFICLCDELLKKSVGLGQKHERGEHGENEKEAKVSPSTFPLSFIREVRWEVFIISPGGVCIYKRVFWGYKWVLNIISQAPRLSNWFLNTNGVPNIWYTLKSSSATLFDFDQNYKTQ